MFGVGSAVPVSHQDIQWSSIEEAQEVITPHSTCSRMHVTHAMAADIVYGIVPVVHDHVCSAKPLQSITSLHETSLLSLSEVAPILQAITELSDGKRESVWITGAPA